jgi:hypothetical protein
MSLEMGLHQGGSTRISTHGAEQTEKDSKADHDRSTRKSVRLSTRGSKFIARQSAMPWHQGCSLTNSRLTYPKITKKSMRMSSISR